MLLSDFIKENTAELHDAAENQFRSKKIFEKGYSVEDYRQFMAQNLNLVETAEAEIVKHLPQDFSTAIGFADRHKTGAIRRDAEHLGLKTDPVRQEIPAITPFEAIGMLYVLEGASLGGNVIKKQLQKTPGFEQVEFHYLGMYGENLGRNWGRFITILNEYVPEDRFEEVLSGARKAYQIIIGE